MTGSIRVLLILGSVLTTLFILRRVRKSQILIEDSIFWLGFSGLLLFISVFPGVVYWLSARLGFQAPISMVYLLMFFLLILKMFFMTVRLSQMDAKLRSLTETVALEREKREAAERAAASDKTDL